MPLVSAIIPTYNRAGQLRRAIESILSQTYQDFEILVTNDGGQDVSAIVNGFHDPRIISLNMPHGGPSCARNAGIRAARGRYIALCDDDDQWLNEKLARNVAMLEKEPDAALVYSNGFFVDVQTGKRSLFFQHPAQTLAELFCKNTIYTCAVLIRASCLTTTGMFDENISFSEDVDLWLRIAQSFRIIADRQPLAEYFLSSTSPTTMIPKQDILQAHFSVIKRRFETILQESPQHLSRTEQAMIRSAIAFKEAKALFPNNNRWLVFQKLCESIRWNPRNIRPYLFLPIAILGKRLYPAVVTVYQLLFHRNYSLVG